MPAHRPLKSVLLAGATAFALVTAGSALAFPSRGIVTIEELRAPLADDATKRTFDFMKRFDVPSITQVVDVNNCSASAENFRQYVIAYNDRLDRFLAGPTSERKLKADRPLFQRGFRTLDGRIDGFVSRIEGSGRSRAYVAAVSVEDKMCIARINLYNLLALREAVSAIGRIYPDMEEVQPALAKLDAAIEQVGDEDMIRARIESNITAAIADVRMEPWSGSNPEFAAALKRYFTATHPDRSFIKQNLLRSNWEITRHWLTGVPIKRGTGTQIASKWPDGKCYLSTILMFQDFNGRSYGGNRFSPGEEVQILCENI